MKTSKIIAFVLIMALTFTLVSCKKDKNVSNNTDNSTDSEVNETPGGDDNGDFNNNVTPGDNQGSENITNGGNSSGGSDDSNENDASKQLFIYSLNSDKFHLPTCSHISRINEESRVEYEGKPEDLVALNKSPCEVCDPYPGYEGESENGTSQIPEGTTFILNKRSMKFHEIGCHSAISMSEENKEYSSKTREEIISDGYTACENCNP